MNLRKTLISASIAALPVMAAMPTQAATASLNAQNTDTKTQSLLTQLAQRDAQLGLGSDSNFRIANQHPGTGGNKITRVEHTYKGLRVFGSEEIVVTDTGGEIVSVSVAEKRAGLEAGANLASTESVNTAQRVVAKAAPQATPPANIKPAFSADAAIARVAKQVAPTGEHRWPPTAELLIYPVTASVRTAEAADKADDELNALDLEEVVERYALAYYVKTRMVVDRKPVYYDTILDARTGEVIAQWRALQTVVGTGNSQYNGAVPINTSLNGSTYQMLDTTRGTGGKFGGMAITNANHSSQQNPSSGSIYTNSTNTWGDGKQYISGGSTTNANGQTAAVNALWGLMNTYDTNKNVLGWKSLDGNNTATYIAVHVDNAYDNAFFDPSCKCMYIGDGGQSFYNLGSIDVIGHEMSHGITDATSNLVYAGESGGLNESNSDIGGDMVEAYARNGGTGTVVPAGNDWMTGKEIARNGQPLRWMYKPSKDGRSPDAWSSTIKNIDVHLSSGPNNRMFYFLSQGSNASSGSDYYSKYLTKSPAAMTGIGNDKAYRIWFKALTTKFTSSTNYADARAKVLLAAQELYGASSKEAIAVQRAYAAINVGSDVDEAGSSSGSGLSISTQPASISVAAGATASFSVGASGGTAPYSYIWYRNGAVIAGASSATYSFTATQADNGATFKALVRDASSTTKTATSSEATLTVAAAGSGGERLTNGGFESGTTGWAGDTGTIGTFSGQTAYEGQRYAWLGGNGKRATETLTQSVAIPSSASSAKLSFALHIDTAEVGQATYDTLVVTVKNSAGTVLGTLATYSNANAASGYQVRNFDLSAYRGQTVTLSFVATEDSAQQTSFVIDKVSLITQ
ncbi:bacillolysin family protein [Duganella sp. Leaf126]|uniref:M4 family metallopeptidase n=1 Tax=Duganella sp. Leaf126 TaxID=1736266 RepID=UPI0006F9C9B6|nr:M4 family metallopeptidase [Duganella sp. Leaf126]KQQ47384.1 bacillolysin family protein [Duganella sp. Leaf126]